MTHYLVTAKPISEKLDGLRESLDDGTIRKKKPFGSEMSQALKRARKTEQGEATWEEVCYCPTPLMQEREVLDRYFTEIETEVVRGGKGWESIGSLPSLWDDTS